MEAAKTTVEAEPSAERQKARQPIARLKEAITLERYLRQHGVEVRHGRAKCIVHGGDNPQSFQIFPDQRWTCHACLEGGDLIDLCELVERHADTWTAIVSLKEQFNVELPVKSDHWHRRQDQKGHIREAAAKAIARRYQRRLVKLYAPLALLGGETPAEELACLEELGAALWPYCMDLAKRRVNDAA